MGLIDRIKTDKEFKTKFLRATIFFSLFIVGLIIFAFTQGADKNKVSQETISVAGGKGWIPGDSTGIGMQKNEIYQNVITDSVNRGVGGTVLGGSITQNQQTVQAEDKTLDNYMAARQQSINKMQNSGTSYSSSESYSYSTPKRRNYNPNGSSGDWSSISTSVTGEKVISSSVENPSQYKRTLPTDKTPDLVSSQNDSEKKSVSNLERRRLLLQTGKRDQSNTQSIKAAVDGNQSVRNGQTIRLKLMQDAFINNKFVKNLATIFATVSFGDNRLMMNIRSININGEIIACNLTVYATDGQPGLPVDLSSISSANDAINQEVQRGIGSSRVGQVISSLFRGSNRNTLKIKVLNNHQIILVQNS